MYTKQSICSSLLDLFCSKACSKCPIPDFIVPVTMSQIGHVFGGFFSSDIDNIHIKHDKYVIMFSNIIYLLQLTRENHQHSNFWAGLNDGLFSETMDFRDFPSVLSAVRIAQS